MNVLYAASLTHLNEDSIGPAFGRLKGYEYRGQGRGSLAIANLILDGIEQPDVIELADPAINGLLKRANQHAYVRWFFTFARTQLVVGFNPRSRSAAQFRAAQRHRLSWYRALSQPNLKLGRTDPNLDPKGYRTLFMAGLAERVYHLRGFEHRLFGSASNPSQIFPEEVLAARLLSGQLDAGIFYLPEAKELGIPFLRLPSSVNLGDPSKRKLYATQHFTSANGKTFSGAPILFTITIPARVPNPSGAKAFVAFALGARARSISTKAGLLSTRVVLHGPKADVPKELQRFIGR